ncbi:hypothetical protein ACO0LB_02685 [Undibacterium sp. SXout7W]|uniref:hypothetical protein n=1 Tax=Undibacterium sp. SXout7W TaxID=3413049 RepID=UPI003BF43616
MARSTKASNAVQRLKERSNNARYSMVSMADGRFYLTLSVEGHASEVICDAMEMDDFVAFVNGLQKQAPKRVSQLDVAFEKKLQHSRQK